MNANTKPVSICLLPLLAVLVTVCGCSSKQASVPTELPERIIREFRDMQEHEIVSWAWIRRGFSFDNCRTITVKPVSDSSPHPLPWVSRSIESGLHDMLKDQARNDGALDVHIHTAVLDVRPDRSRIKRWFFDIDDFPYIEIEMLIADGETGLPLAKISHYSRDRKSLEVALSNILRDFERFFSTNL